MKKFHVGQLYLLVENSFFDKIFYEQNTLFTLIHYLEYGRYAEIVFLSQDLKIVNKYTTKIWFDRKFV
mgnify:CR=1 FL=1